MQRVIGEDHPALAGHFPGNPVVPGVLILEEVLLAIESWCGRLRSRNVSSAKFTSPLRPGDVFSIELHEKSRSQISFACTRDGIMFASGTITVELDSGAP